MSVSVHPVDCVVLGAGIVGVAIARALQMAGREVLLCEREDSPGTGASSRNSEVIHAGIYYPTGSLKARLCVDGRRQLYEYCATRDVPVLKLGKIVIAVSDAEVQTLQKYFDQATTNGVEHLRWIDTREIHALEPEVVALAGFLSPETGIVDSHSLLHALLTDFEVAGGILLRATPLRDAEIAATGVVLSFADTDATVVRARTVVNSCGIHAPAVARRIQGLRPDAIPTSHFAIGHYYAYSGASPFSRLVYPIPSGGGLGVHVTLALDGSARFGPDIRWRTSEDYSFDDSRRAEFVNEIRRYYPALDAARLHPAYTGIRAKISGPEDPSKDFVIDHHVSSAGSAEVINLFGIESPGLTASLSLADEVNRLTIHRASVG